MSWYLGTFWFGKSMKKVIKSLRNLRIYFKTFKEVEEEIKGNNLRSVLPIFFVIYLMATILILVFVTSPLVPFVYSLF